MFSAMITAAAPNMTLNQLSCEKIDMHRIRVAVAFLK